MCGPRAGDQKAQVPNKSSLFQKQSQTLQTNGEKAGQQCSVGNMMDHQGERERWANTYTQVSEAIQVQTVRPDGTRKVKQKSTQKETGSNQNRGQQPPPNFAEATETWVRSPYCSLFDGIFVKQ